MKHDDRHHCFYCRRPYTKANFKTVDHVYANGVKMPAAMRERANRIAVAPRDLPSNKVNACSECNGQKGGYAPCTWLTLCPSDAGAAALAALLLELGEKKTRIAYALSLRSPKL